MDKEIFLGASFDEVDDKLSYDSLKKLWNDIKDKVKMYFEKYYN